jgi:spermidine synthase
MLGLIPMILLGLDKKFATKVGILIILATFFSLLTQPAARAVYSHDGVYEKITISDGTYNGRPTRFLFQDRSASGAMFLDSDELTYEYTKYYALHELFTPNPERVLVIGGGAYSLPKAFLYDLPHATVDVSEIEPSLVELGEKYFKVPKNNPRLNHYIADGRRLLQDATEKYDVIFSDVYYSLYSIPMHFTTQEFFQTAYDKLNDDGIFIANIIGSLDKEPPSLVFSEIKTLQTVFPNVYLFGVESTDSQEPQNMIVVAHKSKQPMTFDTEKLQGNPRKVIRELAAHQVDLDLIDLSPYPKLSDDFAPVENWTAALLRRRESH